jgi:Tfp pilus assembly protein PilF
MSKIRLKSAEDKTTLYLRPVVVLTAVWVLALTMRLIYLHQLKQGPLFDVLMGDAVGYDKWAREIAGGEWLGKDVFYQAPLYPYFMGAWYAVAGTKLAALRAVQILLGATSCVFLASAGNRLFSPIVGTIAGICLAMYPSAIYFDALVQKTVLDNFFMTLLLLLVSLVTLRPTRLIIWLLLGVTAACMALSRENALILPVTIIFWLWVYFRDQPWQQRAQWAGLLLLGMALLLLPVAWRNHYVGGGFHLTTSQFGTNLYIGNNETANGSYVPLRAGHGNVIFERSDAIELAQQKTGKALTPSEVSSFWTAAAFAYMREHPADWLRLIGRKFLLVWNAYEISDTDDQYLAGRWSPILRALTKVFHFGVICPVAAIGIALWPERNRVWLLYLILALYSASVIAFYVLARYRYPLLPVLLLFAAAGVVEVVRRTRNKNYSQLVLAGIIAAAIGVFVNWPTALAKGLDATALYNIGVAQLKNGQPDDATFYSNEALKINPNHWGAHNTLGRIYAAQGNYAAAAQKFQLALQIEPKAAELHNNLGNTYVAMRRFDDAIHEFQEAIHLDASYADAHNGLGVAYVNLGSVNEAGAEFHRAMELDPNSPDAKRNYNLILKSQQQGGRQ